MAIDGLEEEKSWSTTKRLCMRSALERPQALRFAILKTLCEFFNHCRYATQFGSRCEVDTQSGFLGFVDGLGTQTGDAHIALLEVGEVLDE